jgi:hypothetical protein
MDELYLIAHKVRSELAFDIAQRVVRTRIAKGVPAI